jgi:predicted N-formylglutamate amidohydrolase
MAWDIGAGAVCCLIGKALDAVVVRQNYSRQVIDCNRTPGSDTSVLDLSERTRVPGNIGLSQRHKLARFREIFQPITIASRPSSIADEKPRARLP